MRAPLVCSGSARRFRRGSPFANRTPSSGARPATPRRRLAGSPRPAVKRQSDALTLDAPLAEPRRSMPELGSRSVRHSRRSVWIIVVAAAIFKRRFVVFGHVNERPPVAVHPGGSTAHPDNGDRIRVGGYGDGSPFVAPPSRNTQLTCDVRMTAR